jgi:hypothetical protein
VGVSAPTTPRIAGPEEAAALLQDLLDAPVRLQRRDRTLTVEKLGERAPAETVAIAWRREHQAGQLEFDPQFRPPARTGCDRDVRGNTEGTATASSVFDQERGEAQWVRISGFR